jgi:hypothetical protein
MVVALCIQVFEHLPVQTLPFADAEEPRVEGHCLVSLLVEIAELV